MGWGRTAKPSHVGRGLAIADQLQGVGQPTASVTIDASGQVHLCLSLWDTGTGAHTIMRHMVAETLTLPTQLALRAGDGLAAHGGKGVCGVASQAQRVASPSALVMVYANSGRRERYSQKNTWPAMVERGTACA
jgi:CO/xanthine dehydrogenase Mo-binding subunit